MSHAFLTIHWAFSSLCPCGLDLISSDFFRSSFLLSTGSRFSGGSGINCVSSHLGQVIKTQNSVCQHSLHLTLVFYHSLPSPHVSITRRTGTQASTPTVLIPFCACSCQHPSLISGSQCLINTEMLLLVYLNSCYNVVSLFKSSLSRMSFHLFS